MSKALAVVGATAAIAASALVGYAVYFDYKRRHDPEFRRTLKRDKKAAEKKAKEQQMEKEEKLIQMLTNALKLVKDQVYPDTPEECEKFFADNLQKGDLLLRTDPSKVEEIAACFFKALKVYPNAVELLKALASQLPEDISGLLYAMLHTEAEQKEIKHFQELTSKFPSVEINNVGMRREDGGDLVSDAKKVLFSEGGKAVEFGMFAKKELFEGDVVYIEDPLAVCMSNDALLSKQYCCYCLNKISEDNFASMDEVPSCTQCNTVVFCSEACVKRGQSEFHKALCPGDTTNKAAKRLYDYCVKMNVIYPYFVARFMSQMIYKQVIAETILAKDPTKINDVPDINAEWENIERLLASAVSANDEATKEDEYESKLILQTLKLDSPGGKQLLSPERYALMKKAFSSYSYAVSVDGSNKMGEALINWPLKQVSVKQENLYAVGLYLVSAYIREAEESNVVAMFKFPPMHHSNSKKLFIPSPKLVLKATRHIKEGEELLIPGASGDVLHR